MPASVVDAVRARVARLGPAAQRVLETAALAEDGSTLAEIQGATALSDWEALDGIERAMAAHVVDRAGAGYRFVHALVRLAIRSAMSPERQRLLHAKLAATLEPLQAAPERIAMHWQQAGQAERAAQAWIRAADSASALHAHREAMEHFERAAALAADEALAFELHGRAIEHAFRARMRDEAARAGAQAARQGRAAGSSTARFQALTHAADQASLDHDFALSEQYALRALREFEPPDGRIHVQALACAAFAALQLDRQADALDTYRTALDVARRAWPRQGGGADGGGRLVHGDRSRPPATRRRRCATRRSRRCTTTRDRRSACPGAGKGSFVSRALRRPGDGDRRICRKRARSAGRTGSATPCRSTSPTCARPWSTTARPGRRASSSRSWRASIRTPDAELRHLTAFTAAVVAELHGELGDAIASVRLAIAAADEMAALRTGAKAASCMRACWPPSAPTIGSSRCWPRPRPCACPARSRLLLPAVCCARMPASPPMRKGRGGTCVRRSPRRSPIACCTCTSTRHGSSSVAASSRSAVPAPPATRFETSASASPSSPKRCRAPGRGRARRPAEPGRPRRGDAAPRQRPPAAAARAAT